MNWTFIFSTLKSETIYMVGFLGGRMEILLHCGETKTGSSAIQAGLFKHRDVLLDHGVLYEADGGAAHYCLSLLVGKKHRVDEYEELRRVKKARRILERIQEKILSNQPDYLLLSSEYFHLYSRENIDDTLSLIGGARDKIHAILYLRCPISFYLSSVQQTLKASYDFPPPDTYEKHIGGNLSTWMDYVGTDRLHARIFDREKLLNGCVIQDFSQLLTDITGKDIPPIPVARVNESLSAEQMIVLQKFRRDFLADKEGRNVPMSMRLVAFFSDLNVKRALPLSRPRLSAKAIRAMYENARQSCREVDALCPHLGFEEFCFAHFAGGEGPGGVSFSPSVASILEAYDPYMVKVLESCIPSYNTGLRYRLGGDFLDADVVCNKSFFEALGRYLFSEEAYKAASQAFARALQYDEGDPYLHVKVGRSFLVLGDFVQAMKQVQRAIQIKDNEPDFYLFLGELMLAKGDPGGAEAAMRKAEELMR